QFSLRLLSDLRANRHVPVLIVRHTDLLVLDAPETLEPLRRLRKALRGIASYIPVITVLAGDCLVKHARFGIYRGQCGSRVVTAEQLAARLAPYLPGMCDAPGAHKPVYHQARDAFQGFTRAHLAGHLVIQDCDVLRLVDGRWQAVELKRVREQPATWQPYTDDARNFQALAAASAELGMLHPLCMGYRKVRDGEHPIVALHEIRTAGNNAIEGVRCTCHVEEVWQAQPKDPYTSTRKVQR
ncbi:MAG TPA: hypothetical protein VFF81_12775, partial [Noviherbaspirillum sp.]|nr:hypothetical protein [Noviherbaspirillum sp.]